MVKRMVKIAQVVCAVYCLNKPIGASRAEVAKFCALRFGTVRTPKVFDRVLERAVDQGLLTSFRRRYRVARSCSHIIWSQEKKRKKCNRARRSNRQNKEKKLKLARLRRLISIREKNKNNYVCKSSQGCSSFYKSWYREKLKTEMAKELRLKRKSTRMRRNREIKHCTVHNRVNPPPTRCGTSRTAHRHHVGRRGIKVKFNVKRSRQGIKSLRSRHKHPAGSSRYKNIDGILKKSKSKRSSKASSKSSKKTLQKSKTSFYRQILRQTKQATTHAQSWDSLNESRQRHNQRIAKQILTKSHGASWDQLNNKLRRIKECKSRPVVDDDHRRPKRSASRSRKPRHSYGR